jgi:hypothetical protein
MPESELGAAREAVDKFIARFQVQHRNTNEQGIFDVIARHGQRDSKGSLGCDRETRCQGQQTPFLPFKMLMYNKRKGRV